MTGDIISAFIGAILGIIGAWGLSWWQELRIARHRFGCALFRLEHALNHQGSKDIYEVFTNSMVFEIWETGLACAMHHLPSKERRLRRKIGELLGLMSTIEGEHKALTDRSLPPGPQALIHTDELFVMLGYKKQHATPKA